MSQLQQALTCLEADAGITAVDNADQKVTYLQRAMPCCLYCSAHSDPAS